MHKVYKTIVGHNGICIVNEDLLGKFEGKEMFELELKNEDKSFTSFFYSREELTWLRDALNEVAAEARKEPTNSRIGPEKPVVTKHWDGKATEGQIDPTRYNVPSVEEYSRRTVSLEEAKQKQEDARKATWYGTSIEAVLLLVRA